MPEKPRLYLETTIPSYLVARPSRDLVISARQQLTRDWWDTQRQDYEIFIAQPVLDEVSRGDAAYAADRRKLLETFASLAMTPEVEDLARQLKAALNLPERATVDSLHLAVATVYQMEYLLTWNLAHLANAHVRRNLERFSMRSGLVVPTICTPEDLIETEG
jgi:hypothetical protein